MSLWSSSNLSAESRCPRQALWRRQGKHGAPWAGYRVGSWVHDALHAKGERQPEPPMVGLSVTERAEARRLLAMEERAGLVESVPEGAEWEQQYLAELIPGERPIFEPIGIDHPAARGPNFDPAQFEEGSWFRLAFDVMWAESDRAVVWDWKTAMGEPGSISDSPQVICYGAASALLAEQRGAPVERVDVTLWYLRYVHARGGRTVDWPAEWFIERAQALWDECIARDQQSAAEIEEDYRPGAHCGMCDFRASCLRTGPEAVDGDLDDLTLWRFTEKQETFAKELRGYLKGRLELRTSALEVGGRILEEVIRPGVALPRGKGAPDRSQLLMDVAKIARDHGVPFADLFTPKGSTAEWIAALPLEAKDLLAPLLKATTRTAYEVRSALESDE